MAILRLEEVKRETGIRAHSTIYDAVRAGLFPKPIHISQRAVGWLSDEIELLCSARAAGYGEEQIRDLVSQMNDDRITRFKMKLKQSTLLSSM